jgi:hypothetical protein
MKKIMERNDVDTLPLEDMGLCLINIVAIFTDEKYFTNPNAIWPLINLIVKLLKVTPAEMIVNEFGAPIIDRI